MDALNSSDFEEKLKELSVEYLCAKSDDVEYKLFPLFYNYGEENLACAGFAIDVNEDHFFVYPCVFYDLYKMNERYIFISKEVIGGEDNEKEGSPFLRAYSFILEYIVNANSNLPYLFDKEPYMQLIKYAISILRYNENELNLKNDYLLFLFNKFFMLLNDYKNIFNRLIGFNKLDVDHLSKLISTFDIYPPKELVLKAYEKFLKKFDLHHARVLYEVTNIEIPEPLVQNTYKNIFAKSDFSVEEIFLAKTLFEITGIKPPENLIQNAYKKFFEGRNILSTKILLKSFNIAPSEDLVQEIYEEIFIQSYISFRDIFFAKGMFEITNIEIPEPLVQNAYKNIIVEQDLSIRDIKLVEILFNFTGVKIPENLVEIICKYLHEKNPNLVEKFRLLQ